MPNTRGALKRVRQSTKKHARNNEHRSAARTALKKAIRAIAAKDLEAAKTLYPAAVKSMSKAASKGALPEGRVSRKISRLTLMAKKTLPEALNFKN